MKRYSTFTFSCTLLKHLGAVARTRAFFGQGSGAILLDDVRCTGNELLLTTCPSISFHNCVHAEDAGVECRGPARCVTGTIRLVGGTSVAEGRVEICYNGMYGTVCDDFWGTTDAQVVCRQLGYSSTGE